MPKPITYLTSSPSGDLISFLSGIRQIWLDSGRKGIIFNRLNTIGGSYEGAEQPYEDEFKNPILFNQYTFDMVRPLLLSQDYIEDYIVFTGQDYEIDFDKLRLSHFTNQPKGSLNRWASYVFPQMNANLAEVWVNVPRGALYKDKIILNFTLRNRNHFINYFFLKKHEEKLIFAGLKNEYEIFCKEWGLDIPLLVVKDFYELATILNGCKFVLGNQSFVMQLCEAMKVPRIMEAFPMMPTHVVVGEWAKDFYHQTDVEYTFNKFLNKDNEKQIS